LSNEDESQNFYLRLGGTPHLGAREWRWPGAGKIKFAHLQFDITVYDWQGAQITLICFDEPLFWKLIKLSNNGSRISR
jgi:hypothetical protein